VTAFFAALGEGRYRASEHTRGPWSPAHQHGGPPAALMAHGMAALLPSGAAIARVTVEFVRPVPIGELELTSVVLKAGRSVTTLSAALSAGGVEVARAAALAMRTLEPPAALPLPAEATTPPRAPAASDPFEFPFFATPVGYHTAMEARRAAGEFGAGPTQMWMRARVALIAGQPLTPLARVLCAADSGNGVSPVLDPKEYTFVNPDLSVALWRPPAGEWVCLDAVTRMGGHGIGLSDTLLWDEAGPIGRGLQTLLVAPRLVAPR